MSFRALFCLLAVSFCALAAAPAWAQNGAQEGERIKIAFYNVENLFDTIHSPDRDDGDFTPEGRYRWNSGKYNEKIANIARVIDDLGADIIGLAEIESETAVRDLVMALRNDYNYIFLPSGDYRGISQALLFRGDTFFPDRSRLAYDRFVSRQPLVVNGRIGEQDFTFIVCHLPSKLNSEKYRTAAAASLRGYIERSLRDKPHTKLVVMGDFNADPSSKIAGTIEGEETFNPFARLARQGYGTYSYRDKRYFYDYMILSDNIAVSECGIFAKEYMFGGGSGNAAPARTGYPSRSIESGNYKGGFSDHLPVFITLEKEHP